MSGNGGRDSVLACCHGFAIAASDQDLGVVETPVFSGTALGPDYLIVRTADSIPGGFAVVPVGLVAEIDPERRLISLGSRVDEIVSSAISSA